MAFNFYIFTIFKFYMNMICLPYERLIERQNTFSTHASQGTVDQDLEKIRYGMCQIVHLILLYSHTQYQLCTKLKPGIIMI